MATFDPSKLYMLHALQSGTVVSGYDGTVPLTGYAPMVVESENLTPTHTAIETNEILPAGQRSADLRGKKTTSGKNLGVIWTPDNHAHLLADCHGGISTAALGTAYKHTLTYGTPRRRTYRVWRDEGRPTTWADAMVSAYTLSVQGNAALSGQVTLSMGEYYRLGHATVESGGAGVAPRLRGIPRAAVVTDGGPIYAKVISIDPGVSVTVEIALSAHTYAGTASLTIPLNTWVALRDHQTSGSPRLGDVESELEMMITDDTGYLANDEWSFELYAAYPTTPSTPTYTRIPGPRAFITAAGSRRQVDSIEVRYERTIRQPENPGGVFSRSLLPVGSPLGTVQLTRDVVDADFIDYLENGGAFDVELLGYAAAAALDAATDDRTTIPQIKWTGTDCTLSGDEPGIGSADQRQESLTAKAASVTVEVVNASATI